MMNRSGKKVALITGVTGQDGAFLARRLVNKGFHVFGSVRRGGSPKTDRLKKGCLLTEPAGTTGSCIGHNGCKDLAANFCELVRYPSPDLLTSTLAATPSGAGEAGVLVILPIRLTGALFYSGGP